MNSNKWEIVKCKKFTNNFPNNHTEKSVNFPVIVFESSVQFKGGRYEADMPWKPDVPELVNNFVMAVSPLRSAGETSERHSEMY